MRGPSQDRDLLSSSSTSTWTPLDAHPRSRRTRRRSLDGPRSAPLAGDRALELRLVQLGAAVDAELARTGIELVARARVRPGSRPVGDALTPCTVGRAMGGLRRSWRDCA